LFHYLGKSEVQFSWGHAVEIELEPNKPILVTNNITIYLNSKIHSTFSLLIRNSRVACRTRLTRSLKEYLAATPETADISVHR